MGRGVPVLCDDSFTAPLVAGRQTACSAHVLRLWFPSLVFTELASTTPWPTGAGAPSRHHPSPAVLNRRPGARGPAYGGVVVLSADLDGLKGVNDSAGHHAGDAALVRFADLCGAPFARGCRRPRRRVASSLVRV